MRVRKSSETYEKPAAYEIGCTVDVIIYIALALSRDRKINSADPSTAQCVRSGPLKVRYEIPYRTYKCTLLYYLYHHHHGPCDYILTAPQIEGENTDKQLADSMTQRSPVVLHFINSRRRFKNTSKRILLRTRGERWSCKTNADVSTAPILF